MLSKPSRNPWVRLRNAYRKRSASVLFRRPLHIRLETPVISFTFDDFPRSALLAGGDILNRFGLSGTYYVSLGLLGQQTPTGQMFVASDLPLLLQGGHELGCHTFSHYDSWDTDSAAFEHSVLENRAALHRMLPGADFRSFSYPISLPRPLTKARIADYFQCCRGGGQTFNSGKSDLNQLSAYFLEKSRHDIQPIREMIDRNRQSGGWLIFATHDISDDPTPFGCTPEFFEQVVEYAVGSGAHILPVAQALETIGAPVRVSKPVRSSSIGIGATVVTQQDPAKPLVSILIPAFNAQEWISDTLRSAVGQTWERKEIIVIDDGSTDQTSEVAKRFESQGVSVVTQKNQGAAAARNHALSLSQGEYIQWLDADDLLAPDKISRQMAMLDQCKSKRVLLSGEFGKFLYRWHRTQFVPTELWCDLTPTEWLLRKMGENLYMQTATWLVSRELCEAAGLWDTRMLSDDDGEYFCRILLASEGTRFVPEAKVYYRGFGYDSLQYVGKSNRKREALWLSMQLHIQYLRSLEDSPRTRHASVTYLQRNLINFYPERDDIVKHAERIAVELGGELRPPHLSWKYYWIKAMFGWRLAKSASFRLRRVRWASQRVMDKALFRLRNWKGGLAIPGVRPDLPTRHRVPQ